MPILQPQTIFKITKYDKELLMTDPYIFQQAREDIQHNYKLESKEDENTESCVSSEVIESTPDK